MKILLMISLGIASLNVAACSPTHSAPVAVSGSAIDYKAIAEQCNAQGIKPDMYSSAFRECLNKGHKIKAADYIRSRCLSMGVPQNSPAYAQCAAKTEKDLNEEEVRTFDSSMKEMGVHY